jgi:hypothetical protein
MAQEALVCVQDRLSEPRTLSREGKRERIVDAGEADLRGIAELVLILAVLCTAIRLQRSGGISNRSAAISMVFCSLAPSHGLEMLGRVADNMDLPSRY